MKRPYSGPRYLLLADLWTLHPWTCEICLFQWVITVQPALYALQFLCVMMLFPTASTTIHGQVAVIHIKFDILDLSHGHNQAQATMIVSKPGSKCHKVGSWWSLLDSELCHQDPLRPRQRWYHERIEPSRTSPTSRGCLSDATVPSFKVTNSKSDQMELRTEATGFLDTSWPEKFPKAISQSLHVGSFPAYQEEDKDQPTETQGGAEAWNGWHWNPWCEWSNPWEVIKTHQMQSGLQMITYPDEKTLCHEKNQLLNLVAPYLTLQFRWFFCVFNSLGLNCWRAIDTTIVKR